MKGPIGSNVRRGIVGVAMAVAMLATVGVGVAQAATVTTQVSAAYSSHFHGKVSSSNKECVAHRKVRVYKKTSSGRKLQGSDTSNTKGSWSVDLMHAHGKYVAVVPAQKVMSVSCGGAKSHVVDVM